MLNPENRKQSRIFLPDSQQQAARRKIDNFYYPFLNSFIFPFEQNLPSPPPLPSPLPVKLEPIENCSLSSQPPSERATWGDIVKEEADDDEGMLRGVQVVVRDRNILSNNTNLILSLIRRPSKSQHRVGAIINQLNAELGHQYTLQRYYSYQTYIKENVNDYRNKNAIQVIVSHCDPACDIFSLSEQLFFNRVCRTLIRHYIHNSLRLDVLSLKKIKKTSRGDHLKVQRYLGLVLQGAKSAQECSLYKL